MEPYSQGALDFQRVPKRVQTGYPCPLEVGGRQIAIEVPIPGLWRKKLHQVQRPSLMRQAARACAASVLPRDRLLFSGPKSSRKVCLTFDDGPHPENTPRVLEALARQGMMATFFVIGHRAESHPEILLDISKAGHAIGGHTFSHEDPSSTTTRQLMDEVVRTRDLVRDITGETPCLFRPPHGKLTLGKLLGLWKLRQNVVLWNVDPRDFRQTSSAGLWSWFETNPIQSGDVILLHDDRPWGAGIIERLAEQSRNANLTWTTPKEWIGTRKTQTQVKMS